MSSYKLPPISEIKFSESIKRKLYYDPRKIVFNSSNNNNNNNSSNNNKNNSNTISSKSKTELFTDQELLENKNANNMSNKNKEDNAKTTAELSDNTENDEAEEDEEEEINEIEDEEEYDDEDEETDDEFVYLYDENKQYASDYLSQDENEEDETDEIGASNLDVRKRYNSPVSEIQNLKKQLSFLKKENYYMQLAINKLESRLRHKATHIDLNELELQKHLTSIERFLTYRRGTITTTTTTAQTISRPYFRTKLPELNLSRQLEYTRTRTNSRLTLPKLNLDRKFVNDNDEENKMYSFTSRF